MKLYHTGLSTCSQKVRLALAEKGLRYDSQLVNLQSGEQFAPAYLKLNPKAVVPTLEDNGVIYTESTLINEYLDDAYPQVPLKPADASARFRMRALVRRIEDAHPSCSAITYAIALRPSMLKKSPAEIEQVVEAIPDPVRRADRRAVLKDGIQAAVFRSALDDFVGALREAECMLQDSEWIAGDAFSLGDCALLPYVLRLEHLGQTAFIDETMPNLARWYARAQARPSFKAAIVDYGPAPAAFTEPGRKLEHDIRALLD
jgi:glutathione S-transferase